MLLNGIGPQAGATRARGQFSLTSVYLKTLASHPHQQTVTDCCSRMSLVSS